MDKVEISEDISFLLYLFPIFVYGAYAFYLWISIGITSSLPPDVYLAVSESPVIFLVSVLAVCVALVIDVLVSTRDLRVKKIEENTSRMRDFAIIFLILSLISAWSAVGYSLDPSYIFDIYLKGHYSILFPVFLFGLSFTLSPSLKKYFKFNTIIFEVLPFILIIASPLLLYVLWSLNLSAAVVFLIPLSIFIVGIALYLYSFKKREPNIKEI
ncbi:MAG: hypothetical protein L6N96_00830 [Candidatus Methylarchaceae archaeon HK02M2]|nr:hypothetical protein [Candidatus Methylarchaceae archaeon HK02M2]